MHRENAGHNSTEHQQYIVVGKYQLAENRSSADIRGDLSWNVRDYKSLTDSVSSD